MKTAVIIDDEKQARETIKKIIDTFKIPVFVVGEAGNKEEAIKTILETNPDIILLDVMLGEIKSFDVLKELNQITAKIIFISGYNEFAIEAFKFSAIDYLLKPVEPTEFKNAILKATQQLKSEQASLKLDVLLNNLMATNQDKKMVLQTLNKTYIIKVQDILRCESSNNYTQFSLKNGEKILVSKPIKTYEDLLCNLNFFRVHKSHLVNLNYVKGVLKKDGGFLELMNKEVIPISSRKKEKLNSVINSLGFN